jgi:phosphoenolpyruvate synthase/pyruvate phosphate dikinase
MVRFRSSSNAEDALRFNGAGLYDSTSVCVADETDSDSTGPSRCDPDQQKERDVCRGLKKVWASLWNVKAYEEREWYGIDQREIMMGIVVDTRTKNETSNIVAFTGNPLEYGDDRYLINAQVGAFDVVAAVPGVWPEKDLLTLEAGQVDKIERVRGSTELPEGEWVLDDARLRELGALLNDIADVYPVDEAAPPGAKVLLDTEWKLRSDGALVVKQIRPFLSE